MATSLNIQLVNSSSSSTVFAYVTGQAINNNNALFLLQADGKTPYFPTSPSTSGAALAQNVSIPLGAPGSTKTITVPQLAGARLWFSIGSPLTFLLNPGPGLVEPSVTNPSDPNINKTWDFCEFTFNSIQLFANITYVDFVSLPISMTLTDTSGNVQFVAGMNSSGLDTVCNNLVAQNNIDGAGWNQLVVKNSSGGNLRALSPNNGIVMNSNLFANYWTNYVNQVYSKYTNTSLSVDTQASFGTVSGTVQNGVFTFPGGITFAKPSAGDIFSCSTGPFADTSGERAAFVPRMAAAFNRSTYLVNTNTPDVPVSQFYTDPTTNHYSRIVHAANLDHLGYAFPYDDVAGTNMSGVAGTVSSGNVASWKVSVGGVGATATAQSTAAVKTPVPNGEKNIAEQGDQKKLGSPSAQDPKSRKSRVFLQGMKDRFNGILRKMRSA